MPMSSATRAAAPLSRPASGGLHLVPEHHGLQKRGGAIMT